MFDAFGGEAWWPLNSQVSVFRTPAEPIAALLSPSGLAIRGHYPTLAAAVEANAPYCFSFSTTNFLIGVADGSTVLVNSGAPSVRTAVSDVERLAPRLHCDAVGVDWCPPHRAGLGGAGFVDYRYLPPTVNGAGVKVFDQLTLQVSDQGRRWVFLRVAPRGARAERPYEDPEVYRTRRATDRLPFDLLRRYLLACGIPVDDPGYLTGPVLTLKDSRGLVREPLWSTIAELRTIAGYPPSGVPTDIRLSPRTDVEGRG